MSLLSLVLLGVGLVEAGAIVLLLTRRGGGGS